MSELGTRLKQARIEKGYDLEKLQEITKIQKRYLTGIEEGDHSAMPGPFYVRAFTKQYAEAVGLNAHDLLEAFGSEVPVPSNEEVRAQLAAAVSLNRQEFTKSSVSRLGDMLPQVIVVLFVIVTLLILVFFYSKNASDDLQEEKNPEDGLRYEEPVDTGNASKTEDVKEQQDSGE